MAQRGTPRQNAQRDLGDDAERSFRSDEEIDEVHAGRREITGRILRHCRHPVGGHRHQAGGLRAAAFDPTRVAAGEHDGHRTHPVARRAVLEGGGAGCVGGHRAADERAGERRRRRIVLAGRPERHIEIRERHARLHARPIRSDFEDAIEPRGAEQHLAHRRRAAGERRLRADWQHRARRSQNVGDLRFTRRQGDSRRVPAWKVGRVLEKRREHVRIAPNQQCDMSL